MTHFTSSAGHSTDGRANHPLAPRMCAISFLSYNLTLGCMYGTFGVFVTTVETKFGVGRDLSSLGVAVAMAGIALTSPVAGTLAQKFSIRSLMLIGAVMNLVGYVVLALSPSIWVNLCAYALLFGPGLCLTGTVLAPTLVARWFTVNRGRAIGIATMPILIAIAAPAATILLKAYGLSATYGVLAASIAVLIVALLFVVDHPPSAAQPDRAEATARPADRGLTNVQLVRRGSFWALALGAAALTTGAIVLSAHLVPMAVAWGIAPMQAATILSAMPLVGIVGSFCLGWLADRLGGAITLALLCFVSAVVTSAFLVQPPYVALLAISGLLGLCSAAVVPVLSVALSQQFGEATFSRALGLAMLVGLPFNLLGVPLTARVYMQSGSYSGAMAGLAGLFLATAVLSALVRSPKPAPAIA